MLQEMTGAAGSDMHMDYHSRIESMKKERDPYDTSGKMWAPVQSDQTPRDMQLGARPRGLFDCMEMERCALIKNLSPPQVKEIPRWVKWV
jgi:hypothetical protein